MLNGWKCRTEVLDGVLVGREWEQPNSKLGGVHHPLLPVLSLFDFHSISPS